MDKTATLLAAIAVGFDPTNTQPAGNVKFLCVPSDVILADRLFPAA
jgi:hypothetical protein